MLGTVLLKLAQCFLVTFLVTCHKREEVSDTSAHVSLKKRAAAMRIDIEILQVTLNKQFILAITVKVGILVVLPMVSAVTRVIGGVFSFNPMMVNCRTHIPHINDSKEAMAVGIVGLSFP